MKIAVGGAAGRTGRHIVKALVEHPEVELVGALERADHPLLGRDVSVIVEGCDLRGLEISSDLEAVVANCEAFIDFSVPAGAELRVEAAAKAGASLIVGTTGLSETVGAALERAGAQVPVVRAPNMSVGVNVLLQLLRSAAQMLGPGYDFEVFEMHHSGKADAPSGTALRIAEVVAEARGLAPSEAFRHGRVGALGPRGSEEIGIHAARGGDIVGEHTAIFAGPGERIELIHRAHNRDTFAGGAVRAALWTRGRPAGLYTMADVLGGGTA